MFRLPGDRVEEDDDAEADLLVSRVRLGEEGISVLLLLLFFSAGSVVDFRLDDEGRGRGRGLVGAGDDVPDAACVDRRGLRLLIAVLPVVPPALNMKSWILRWPEKLGGGGVPSYSCLLRAHSVVEVLFSIIL